MSTQHINDRLGPGGLNEVVTTETVNGQTVLVGPGIEYPLAITALVASTNTAAQNQAAIQAALTSLYALGNGGTGHILFPSGEFAVQGPILVTGQYPQESTSWLGGIEFIGGGIEATRLAFTTAEGFQIDSTGEANASTMIDFSNMSVIGPGKATAGGVGIDYGPQTASGVVSGRLRIENLYMSDWESCTRFDDVTSVLFERCVFQDYLYAHHFGYNVDIFMSDSCAYGSSLTTLGSQTEIAVRYGYNSLAHPSGALSNNAHVFTGCWFMRQLVAADIYDTSAANIKFDTSYFESCVQYAKLGQSGSTTSPNCVIWDNCHFSVPYAAGESAAKIAIQHTSGNGSIVLYNCRSDSSNGPNGGWIDAGSAAGVSVILEGNVLPTGGSATTQATVRYGTKYVVVPNHSRYLFRSNTSNGRTQEQFNGGSSNANRETWAFGGTSSTVFDRWAVKVTASEAEATGTFPRIIDQVSGGAHYVMWDGYSRAAQSSAAPTAIAELRGCHYVVQGGAGVADVVQVCLKSAADTYSWVTVATG